MNDNKNDAKGFTVLDRRFWAEEDGETEAAEHGESPQKPSYVLDLERKIEEKDKLLEECIAKYKESLNEFEQAKERIQRELSKEVERTRRLVLTDFLEIVDNLDRALASVPDNEASPLSQGVTFVRDLFVEKLALLGAKRIEPLGEKFDPATHEALSVVQVNDPRQEGRIVGVIRQGWILGDSILRPAGVAVARQNNG
jgi:molecular chaperone GrpE